MSSTNVEHREEEEASAGEDEDTGAPVAPIVKLEEIAFSTGEEDEDPILDLKAKLYRFDKEGNQWKKRGAGTVKFLKHKVTAKVRLLMRQSKTFKICANHLILPTMTVQEHTGNEKSCVWLARDFADGELKDELYCIRFASIENCKRFMETSAKLVEYVYKRIGKQAVIVKQKPEPAKKKEKAEAAAKEEAKPAEKSAEEKKLEESKDAKDGKESKVGPASPSPPQPEIVLKVFMHCEGCARKVRRSLKGFPGVEDVVTDCKSHKVVVKGEKVDPLKVLERVQRKSHRQVELLSPIPKPPAEEDKKTQRGREAHFP